MNKDFSQTATLWDQWNETMENNEAYTYEPSLSAAV